MKLVGYDHTMKIIEKYGAKGDAPDPEVVSLARAYIHILETAIQVRDRAKEAEEAAGKIVRRLNEVGR